MKILIACPTHLSKNYAFPRWLEAIQAIIAREGHEYDVLVVDNSPNGEMAKLYGAAVPMEVLPNPSDHPYERINASMEVIRKRFLAGGYDRWFNLECDIVPPADIVDVLLDYGVEADWCGHGYPVRGGTDQVVGIGCALLSPALMRQVTFTEANQDSPDVWLWEKVRNDRTIKTVELWNVKSVEHLEG